MVLRVSNVWQLVRLRIARKAAQRGIAQCLFAWRARTTFVHMARLQTYVYMACSYNA